MIIRHKKVIFGLIATLIFCLALSVMEDKIWLLLAVIGGIIIFAIHWRWPMFGLALVFIIYYLRGDGGIIDWLTITFGDVRIYPLDIELFFVVLVFICKLLLKKVIVPSLQLNVPIGIFLLYLIISAINGIFRGHALDSVIRTAFPVAGWSVYFVTISYLSTKNIYKFIKFVYYFGLATIIFAFISKILGFELYSWKGMSIVPLSSGEISRKWGLPYGDTYYSIITLFSIALLCSKDKFIKLPVLYFGLFSSLFLLVVIMIRGIFYATMIGIIFLLPLLRKSIEELNFRLIPYFFLPLSIAGIIFIVLNGSFIQLYIERFTSIILPEKTDIRAINNFQVRLQDFEIARKLTDNSKLLGLGFGLSKEELFFETDQFTGHNGFAKLLLYGGYLGIFLWVLVIVCILIQYSPQKYKPKSLLLSLSAAILAIFVAFVIYNFSSGVLPVSEFSSVVASLLGLMAFLNRKYSLGNKIT